MSKVALHFGAGNIGRGFIAPVLQENDYDVVFVDVDTGLINDINTLKPVSYTHLTLPTSDLV